MLNYTYNQRSLLETMTVTNNYITASQYDTSGRLLERSLNNGTLKATRSYYGWDTYGGRLQTIRSGTTSSPTSMQNLTYQTYDNNGNILRLDNPYEKTSGGTQVSTRTLYEYDDLDRLIQAQMKFITSETQYYLQDYGYDDLGRLETKGGISLTYSEPNGKLHAVSAAGSITYQYDANGNMTARNTGNPVTSFVFSYDSENRLSMATSSNTTLRFVYDGDGSRVETIQTVISTTTTTIMIGGYYEWVSSSDWKKYYFAGSERIAFMKYSNLMYYLFSDHLGSTVVTRYQLGNVYRNGYYPFLLQPKASECFAGEDRYTSSYTPYQFTDQRKEAVIGLYDYHARFYDPSIGRFTSADTIVPGPGSPQSWDRYAYVNNNPINNTDPTGHWVFEYSPNDPNYVPAHSGINPFRRYVTAGVTQSEADKIFKSQIKSPTNSPDPMPHGFGDDRGVREFPDQWFSKRQFHASMDAEHEVGLNTHPIAPGSVFFTGWTDMGNTVIIEHDIFGCKLYSVYGHFGQNRSDDPNKYVDNGIRTQIGDQVSYSSEIGVTGNSKPGCENCDPHLHFEVRYATNINFANSSDPLMGMRYWAFGGENWRDYFFDLGQVWGYDQDNFGGW